MKETIGMGLGILLIGLVVMGGFLILMYIQTPEIIKECVSKCNSYNETYNRFETVSRDRIPICYCNNTKNIEIEHVIKR
jgi:hypothetical protein